MPQTNTPPSRDEAHGLRGLARKLRNCLPARHAPVNRMAEQGSTMQDQAAGAQMTGAEALRLIALDPEDLEVMSCNLQDAVVRVADVAYLPGQRRFAFLANRFDWVA